MEFQVIFPNVLMWYWKRNTGINENYVNLDRAKPKKGHPQQASGRIRSSHSCDVTGLLHRERSHLTSPMFIHAANNFFYFCSYPTESTTITVVLAYPCPHTSLLLVSASVIHAVVFLMLAEKKASSSVKRICRRAG